MPPRKEPGRSRARSSSSATSHVRRTLDNGLTVVAEPMSSIRSVSIGAWVKCGSRHEPEELGGVSHFIEHALFKGTSHRTAPEIARQIDAMGGGLDAFTTKEHACFYAKALATELPGVVDLLADLVRNPLFAEKDVAQERKVVLEEIKMVNDTPDDLVHELFTENLWRGHALGRPILGTTRSVRGLDGNALRGFWRRVYSPANVLVSAAGSFDPERLVDLVAGAFGGGWSSGRRTASQGRAPVAADALVLRHRPSLEQVHLCLGVPAIRLADSTRNVLSVLNTILGGSLSSRLFQSIREERGLAYTVYSFQSAYSDAGYVAVYAGCSPRNVQEVIRRSLEGIAGLVKDLVTPEELVRAKGHLKGSLMLGLESSSGRMSSLARQELYFQRHATLDEMVAQIDAVTAEQVRSMAADLFADRRFHASVVGNLKGLRLRHDALTLA